MEAETLDELKDGLLASYTQLQNLGIFSSIEFLADAGPDVRSCVPFARSLGLLSSLQHTERSAVRGEFADLRNRCRSCHMRRMFT